MKFSLLFLAVFTAVIYSKNSFAFTEFFLGYASSHESSRQDQVISGMRTGLEVGGNIYFSTNALYLNKVGSVLLGLGVSMKNEQYLYSVGSYLVGGQVEGNELDVGYYGNISFKFNQYLSVSTEFHKINYENHRIFYQSDNSITMFGGSLGVHF